MTMIRPNQCTYLEFRAEVADDNEKGPLEIYSDQRGAAEAARHHLPGQVSWPSPGSSGHSLLGLAQGPGSFLFTNMSSWLCINQPRF